MVGHLRKPLTEGGPDGGLDFIRIPVRIDDDAPSRFSLGDGQIGLPQRLVEGNILLLEPIRALAFSGLPRPCP